MIDKSTRKQLAERKERVRRRINTKVDPENYEFIPAKKPIDYYDKVMFIPSCLISPLSSLISAFSSMSFF